MPAPGPSPSSGEVFTGGVDVDRFAEEIIEAFAEAPLCHLSPDCCAGYGVYALYRTTSRGLYAPFAEAAAPLYIGMVAAPGERDPKARTKGTLRTRVGDHTSSLAAAGFRPGDFAVRVLEVHPLLISAAERVLQHHHRPVWIATISGFGLKPPSGQRSTQTRPRWDTLHPGRPWAEQMASRPESRTDLRRLVQAHGTALAA